MNTLPVVFSLLFALTIASSSIIEKRMDSKRFMASHTIANSLDREMQKEYTNLVGKSIVKNNKKPKIPSKEPKSTGKKEDYSGKEKNNEARRCAKLNLYPLLSLEDPEEDPRYQVFINFVMKHYKNAPFFRGIHLEKTAKSLLDSILYSAKRVYEKGEPISLEKLQLQNPGLQKLFYKALKGSGFYSYKNPSSYPKLLEYVTIDSDEYKKICFTHISREMLSSIFDSATSDRVFEAYKETPKVSKKQLTEILLEEQTSIDEEKLKILIFQHVKSAKLEQVNIQVQDALTNVRAEQTQYLGN